MDIEQTIRTFLRDHPTGTLRVMTKFTSGWGIAWLHRSTQWRRVELLIANTQKGRFKDASKEDLRQTLKFLKRNDVEVRTYHNPGGRRAGSKKGGWLVVEGGDQHLLWGKVNLSQKSFKKIQSRGNQLEFGGEQDGGEGPMRSRGNNQKLLRKLTGDELDKKVAYMDGLYAEANDCKGRLVREVREKQQALLKQTLPQLEMETETGMEPELESQPESMPETEPAKQSARWPLRLLTKPRQQKLDEDPGLFDERQ